MFTIFDETNDFGHHFDLVPWQGGLKLFEFGDTEKTFRKVPNRNKTNGSLRWMVPVFRFFEYVNFERKEQKVNSTS